MNTKTLVPNRPCRPTALGAGILLTIGLLSGSARVAAQGPELAIQKAILLDWPVTESQYVPVTADSAVGPWRPLLKPIVRQDDRYQVALPADSGHALFSLVEGVYECEDFSGSALSDWTQIAGTPDSGGIVGSRTAGGALRIQDNGTGWPLVGFFLTDSPCTDFVMSVDLVEWSGDENSVILGRGDVDTPSGVFGALTVNWHDRGVPGEGILWLWEGSKFDGVEPANFILQVDPAVDYRLVLSGAGSRLTLTLYALPDTATPVVPPISFVTARQQGVLSFAVEGDEWNGQLDLTVDNLHAVGVAP